MGRINVCYKKVVPGSEPYSSQQFFLSLEVELPDQVMLDYSLLQLKVKQLFEEVRKGVESQIKTIQPKALEEPKEVQPARTYRMVPVPKENNAKNKIWSNRDGRQNG